MVRATVRAIKVGVPICHADRRNGDGGVVRGGAGLDLQGYLNEFVFRFNRRGSRSRGLVYHRVLELAVAHDPVRYRDFIVNPQPKAAPPAPPGIRGHPPSMDRPRAARLWRAS